MGKTILIVDNDRAVRSMASFVLSVESCVVLEASGVAEALKRLEDGARPELVLAGTNIEGVGLSEFISIIRAHQRCRFSPVVVLADERHLGGQMEWQEAGASCWILKPFTAHQLLEMVGLLGL
ncbi:MAG: response regulator [Deltaproteobacteria bacterium]|nr:response regulator [Deltaproteobacteria bacterium]